jgi:tetratricopeptide (TPR) repeat protein
MHLSSLEYKKGDVIGNKYDVIDILGKGGCGIVYHVYSRETGNVCALKTFLDKYLSEVSVRERFKKEASVWVSLDKHPYIVTAHFVEEIAGRLYIGIEYVEPPDAGWNTLDNYLRYQQVDFVQGLKWAIQFCYGMEHAFNKGIKAHRDIKPANIMIESSKIVKISDFGLAGYIDARNNLNISASHDSGSGNYNQTIMNVGMGTPTHMPPEQFINAAGCDERSDIYSFGVVLYQIASRGSLPFYTDNHSQFWQILQYLHSEKDVPRLESKLDGIIRCCMNKKPSGRYQKFEQLRNDLECLLKSESGEVIVVPSESAMNALEFNNKGFSLNNIGRLEEAMDCLNKAIQIDPKLEIAWCNKGLVLINSGLHNEAIDVLLKAIDINPSYTSSWCNLGLAYDKLGEARSAVQAYQKATQIDLNSYIAFYNLGNCFYKINAFEQATKYYDLVLEIFPLYAPAWSNKGKTLWKLRRYNEALECIDKALEINPMSFYAWYNKGLCYQEINDHQKSLYCFDKAIALNNTFDVLISKGKSHIEMKQFDEAMDCFQQILDSEPNNLAALTSKILCFLAMGQLYDALTFAKISLMILPSTPILMFMKAHIEDSLGMKQEAINSYGIFISIADNSLSEQLRMANGRLAYLLDESDVPITSDSTLSFPAEFSDAVYSQARQQFMKLAAQIDRENVPFKEFVQQLFKIMIAEYGVDVKPYAVKFAKEYESIYQK